MFLLDIWLKRQHNFSSTHMAFSAVLYFCSARRLNPALQVRTGHIPPTQKEPSRTRQWSVITVCGKWWYCAQKKKQPETSEWTDSIPVLSLVLGAAFPALRAAPTITHVERRHIVAHIPLGTPPVRVHSMSVYCRTYSEYFQDKKLFKICLTWKKYALSTGSFSRLWTSAIKVDSVAFTSASLHCYR